MIDKLFDRTYSVEYIVETLKGMSITDEDGCASLIDHNIALGMAINAIERYSKYEDTGITPNQIREIDKLYLEKCQEVNKLKEQVEQMAAVKDIMVRTASAAVCGIGGGAC